ncbi:LysR family transcriptional regulator [Caenimonas sp. SL110]|uniref:LysR family transcriptional regulator n=1 Tax=Caenimonas sp. SL110 TaxID=1450524 RepID=UPI00065303CB|nr:LysR family transcriptional regulator [Caenimonas sp. SL110]
MALMRRFIPSTGVLCAFEASARLQSFTAAAAELHLTQSAVSRQIRSLEETLGSQLFVRERQTIRLTTAGEAYARDIRGALDRISQATLGFRASPHGGTLQLAVLPTFGTRWLAPRLANFFAAHPGVTVNLTTRLEPFDFRSEGLDAAVHFGTAVWPGAQFETLMSETVVPACSPAFRRALKLARPADLLGAPLLHLSTRPGGWRDWFHAKGVVTDHVPGMLVDQFAMAAQAATAGLGVALLPRFLMEPEFSGGHLVPAIARGEVESSSRYHLVWPTSRASYPPLVAFAAWLKQEVAKAGEPHIPR